MKTNWENMDATKMIISDVFAEKATKAYQLKDLDECRNALIQLLKIGSPEELFGKKFSDENSVGDHEVENWFLMLHDTGLLFGDFSWEIITFIRDVWLRAIDIVSPEIVERLNAILQLLPKYVKYSGYDESGDPCFNVMDMANSLGLAIVAVFAERIKTFQISGDADFMTNDNSYKALDNVI